VRPPQKSLRRIGGDRLPRAAPGMMGLVTEIPEDALERATASLMPFVRRWGLSLGPDDLRLLARTVLESSRSDETVERAGERVEALLDDEQSPRPEETTGEAEERFRAVIESAPVAIVEIGLDDKVKLWNPAAERIFGWSAEEVLGRPPVWVPDDRWGEFRALSDQEAQGAGYTGFETVRVTCSPRAQRAYSERRATKRRATSRQRVRAARASA
jgi:PAS domain S-box-containing protein